MNPEKIKQIEKILGQKLDGVWDDKDQTALDKLTTPKKAPKQATPMNVEPQAAGPVTPPATYT
jgi:hypothetical protein